MAKAKKTVNNLYGGFDSAEDLNAKICNEGFDYYFGDYTGPESFAGSVLEQPVKEYIEAKKKLKKALNDVGVGLEDF